jgi:hypothetical protein
MWYSLSSSNTNQVYRNLSILDTGMYKTGVLDYNINIAIKNVYSWFWECTKEVFFFEIDVCGSLLPEVSEDYYYKTGMWDCNIDIALLIVSLTMKHDESFWYENKTDENIYL